MLTCRSFWSIFVLAAFGMPGVLRAAATVDDFEGGGSTATLARTDSQPGPSVRTGGPSGNYLRLTNDVGLQINFITYDQTDSALSDIVTADFDFRAGNGGGADGFAFVLLNTSVASIGITGSATWGRPEEPDVANSVGVAFDFYPNAEDVSDNAISLHFGASIVAQTNLNPASFRLHRPTMPASDSFDHATIIIDRLSRTATVLLRPRGAGEPLVIFDRVAIPGLTAYPWRVGFGGRTGGLSSECELDNVHVVGSGDQSALKLISAETLDNTQVLVTFNKAIETASAFTFTNYSIDHGIGTPSVLTIQSNGFAMLLTVAPLLPSQSYTLTVNNLKDRALVPNTIAANSAIPIVVHGLIGQYYDSQILTLPAASRIDATVDFNFLGNVSGLGLTDDQSFSVRWSGEVEAPADGDYIFTTNCDDGSRLWVDGKLVINNWIDQAAAKINSLAVPLVAGRRYRIAMEYFQGAGETNAQLLWTPPGASEEVIPNASLYATPSPAGNAGQGTGLTGRYYDDTTRKLSGTQIDPLINFGFVAGQGGLQTLDNFSAAWTGMIEAPHTGTFFFRANVDDRVKIFIDGREVLSRTAFAPDPADSSPIEMTAGRRYPIRIEYGQDTGPATLQLSWFSGNLNRTIIPISQFYPAQATRALSVDFIGAAGGFLLSDEVAGAVALPNWNSAAGNQGIINGLNDNAGTATTASVQWSSVSTHGLPFTVYEPDSLMMLGYLDTDNTTATAVFFSNLRFANPFRVYVYCDGDNGADARTGEYYLDFSKETIVGTDGTGNLFNRSYVLSGAGSGNYVLFQSVSTTSFQLLAKPVSGTSPRAPVNGIQIVVCAPEIGTVTPDKLSHVGGTVRLVGTHLAGATATFNGVPVQVTSQDSKTIDLVIPPSAPGIYPIIVTTDGGATVAYVMLTDASPVATPRYVYVQEDVETQIVLSGSDLDGDALTFSILSQPAHGTFTTPLVVQSPSSAAITYKPESNYFGSDRFVFKVTGSGGIAEAPVHIVVTPVNDAPTIHVSFSPTTPEDQNGSIQIDGITPGPQEEGQIVELTASVPDNLIIQSLDPQYDPTDGSAFVFYTVVPDAFGTVPVTLTVNDFQSQNNVTQVTVDVVISPVNDPPTAPNGTLAALGAGANPGILPGYDIDSPNLIFTVATQPGNGAVVITDGATGAYTYTADNNGTYNEMFTYRVSDGTLEAIGTITVNVTFVNLPPAFASDPTATPNNIIVGQTVAFLAAATDPDGGAVTYSWDFKDGSPVSSGAAVSHTFTTGGTFNVEVTATDPDNHSTVKTVLVSVYVPIEAVVTKAGVKFSFTAANKDSLSMSGTLPLAAGYIVKNEPVVVTVERYTSPPMTFDSKNTAVSGKTVSLKLSGKFDKKTGALTVAGAKFTLAIKGVTLFDLLKDAGFVNDDVKGKQVPLLAIITIDGSDRFALRKTLSYTAKKGKSGSGK